MQPHEERVVTEAKELEDKLTKLTAFIEGKTFEGLRATDKGLLLTQREHMVSYHSTLQMRIARFA